MVLSTSSLVIGAQLLAESINENNSTHLREIPGEMHLVPLQTSLMCATVRQSTQCLRDFGCCLHSHLSIFIVVTGIPVTCWNVNRDASEAVSANWVFTLSLRCIVAIG
ncbi:hypothetical protein TNCV_133861 [Trichonephila clavipes]|nr:hypothetical protein TNCV_133861 [Trichonephila clavipes]